MHSTTDKLFKPKRPLVTIKVSNVYSEAHVTNTTLADIICKNMSFFVTNYRYTTKFKSGNWDGKIKFAKYIPPIIKFNTGFLLRVINLLLKNGIDYELIDIRTTPTEHIDINLTDNYSILREYQDTAVKAIIKGERGIIKAPTGSGKTEMFIHLINNLKYPTLILTHTQDLLFQTADRCLKAFDLPEIGIIGAGVIEPSDILTIGLFQTMLSLFKENKKEFFNILNKFPVIIVDEAHHVNYEAKMFSKVIAASDAYYRYAFTATPKRTKSETATDMQLVALFGPPITEIESKELIDDGWLSPFEVRIIKYPHHTLQLSKNEYLMEFGLDADGDMKYPQKAYREAFNDCIINNDDRLKTIGWILNKHCNDQVLISCHSEVLSQRIASMFNIKEITGNTTRYSKKDREETYNKFRNGEIKHLVSTNIYSEGVDFPKLNVIILIEPFKSGILLLQKIGRTMRLSEGKVKGIVYDFYDMHLPFFDEQYKSRIKQYKSADTTPIYITLKESDLVGE